MKKDRATPAPISQADGPRVLKRCMGLLEKLSPEWRIWVVDCLEGYVAIGAEKQPELFCGNDRKDTAPVTATL